MLRRPFVRLLAEIDGGVTPPGQTHSDDGGNGYGGRDTGTHGGFQSHSGLGVKYHTLPLYSELCFWTCLSPHVVVHMIET